MDEPTCLRCGTDAYLEFANYEPPRSEVRAHAVHGGKINRVHHTHAYVEFRCTQCGRFNGHSVPDEWEVPDPNPRLQPPRSADTDGVVRA